MKRLRTMTSLSVCAALVIVVLLIGESSSRRICCTKYDQIKVPIKEIKYYVMQEITETCDIRAVIFQTRINRPVCADPEKHWVKRAIEVVPGFNRTRRHN